MKEIGRCIVWDARAQSCPHVHKFSHTHAHTHTHTHTRTRTHTRTCTCTRAHMHTGVEERALADAFVSGLAHRAGVLTALDPEGSISQVSWPCALAACVLLCLHSSAPAGWQLHSCMFLHVLPACPASCTSVHCAVQHGCRSSRVLAPP